MSQALDYGPALPKGLDMEPLTKKQKLMNKIMKKYIEKVGSEPGDLVKEAKERHWFDKLFGIHPFIGQQYHEGTFKNDFPVMYSDPGLPSYSKILLYGLDFDFLMFECLVIACSSPNRLRARQTRKALAASGHVATLSAPRARTCL